MTSEDRQFWEAVAAQFGRQAQSNMRPNSPSSSAVTAVVLSAPRAEVVTLRIDARGRAHVDETRSRTFELGDRSAHAVMTVFRDAERFFSRRKISHIFVRSGAMTGTFAPHALSIKFETIFQLIGNLRVTFVNTQRVAAWIRREAPELPTRAGPEPGARWAAVQKSAMEAALFAGWNMSSVGLFSDGSIADD